MLNVPDPDNTDFKKLFNRVIEDLKSHPKIVGISLVGSLLSGEQDEFSDVDLDGSSMAQLGRLKTDAQRL